MLSCREMAEQASDHIDKKLTLHQSLSYGFHLLMCGYCRKFIRHLKTTIKVGQGLPEPQPLSNVDAEKIVAQTLAKTEQI